MSRGKAVNQLIVVASILLFLLLATQTVHAHIHQDLTIQLNPEQHQLIAEVVLTPSTPQSEIRFWLNSNLTLSSSLTFETIQQTSVATLYRLKGETPQASFKISYSGIIANPPQDNESIGTIDTNGVSLLSSTYWYPAPENDLITYSLTVSVPQGWTPVTNAKLESSQNNTSVFKEMAPQEDIYLIAAQFFAYQVTKNMIQYQVLLRTEDSALAKTYLDLLPTYIEHYQRQIGHYPYSQFSVVENFWETGYGMPSFTLLGSSVMRLPFILTSSLPHEILHSWWGNGVYVDYSLGNWSEGLTTYQADYWQQRLAKTDKSFRLKQLMEYGDFVANNPLADFPLTEFKGRHDSASQAIGYGKTMMIFEMLESSLGTFQFNRSLQYFYSQNLHKKASYLDLKSSFEHIARTDLTKFFDQWWLQKGAPKIALMGAVRRNTLVNWVINLNLALDGDYALDVPIRINGKNRSEVQVLKLNQRLQMFVLELKFEPSSIEIDPDLKIFRHLYPSERPLTLSSLFGLEQFKVLTVSKQAEAANLENLWRNRFKGKVEVQTLPSTLPQEPLVLIGNDPEILKIMADLTAGLEVEVHTSGLVAKDNARFDLKRFDVALLIPHPNKANTPILWLSNAEGTDFDKWAPRLTHYGTYGYLIFDKTNVPVKGSFPIGKSPLKHIFP